MERRGCRWGAVAVGGSPGFKSAEGVSTLMSDREAVADAVDELVSILEADDAVAFAEVGGVYRDASEVVVTEEGVRSTTDYTTTGAWCRAFSDGAAGYRFTADLSTDALEDAAERAATAGAQLAQSMPARVDVESTHRGAHGGWAHDSVSDRPIEAKREAVEDAAARIEADPERLRLVYGDERAEVSLATTAGSVVRTVLDRADADVTLVPTDGSKVRRHAGTTRGAELLDRLPEVVEALDVDARDLRNAPDGEPPDGPTTVVLGPEAAGQLIHEVAGYLAADTAALGLSPFEPGDEITDAPLTVDDAVEPGSWGALAYDTEGRPATPVRLVDRGRVESFLDDTSMAAENGRTPAGNVVPAIGFEQAPRIHHRHLRVHPGDADVDELLSDADLYVRRFNPAYYRDQFERTQRNGTMPPSPPYAYDVAEQMPDGIDPGTVEFSVAEGFRVEGGELGASVDPTLVWTAETMGTIDGIAGVCRRITGVASKHKSRIPYAVSAPAMRLEGGLIRPQ